MEGLLIVILPLVLGYLVVVKPSINAKVPTYNSKLLYALLFVMGYSLSQVHDLFARLPTIAWTVVVFVVVVHVFNILASILYDGHHRRKVRVQNLAQEAEIVEKVFTWHLFFDISKLIGTIVLGFVIGWVNLEYLGFDIHAYLSKISTFILVIMIFLVGLQLRNSGYKVREILFNRNGIELSVLFVISSMLGGLVSYLFVSELTWAQAMALASGMGWYSLSSVVVNNAWGPILGSTAFFIDLSRELLALLLVPILAGRFPNTAVTQPGATSLDCSLPIIQKSGGLSLVPIAISYGFYINIIVPLLLVLFTAFK